jgi:hypothetical protein
MIRHRARSLARRTAGLIAVLLAALIALATVAVATVPTSASALPTAQPRPRASTSLRVGRLTLKRCAT